MVTVERWHQADEIHRYASTALAHGDVHQHRGVEAEEMEETGQGNSRSPDPCLLGWLVDLGWWAGKWHVDG